MVPATQGAAIPQLQNSQQNKVHKIQNSWKRGHKILWHILRMLQLEYHSLAHVTPCQLQHVVRLQSSSSGKAEIAIVLKHCVNMQLLCVAGFDCQLWKLDSIIPPEKRLI